MVKKVRDKRGFKYFRNNKSYNTWTIIVRIRAVTFSQQKERKKNARFLSFFIFRTLKSLSDRVLDFLSWKGNVIELKE